VNSMIEDTIEFAIVDDEIMVVRVKGRGCNLNSVNLGKFVQDIRQQYPNIHIIFDLEKCSYVDSTFMGTMLMLNRGLKNSNSSSLMVLNVQNQVYQTLYKTGLHHILDIRNNKDFPLLEKADFKKMENSAPISRIEQIVNSLEAHVTLMNLGSENELRFQSVVKYLEDSLEREKKRISENTPPSSKS